MPQIRYLKNYAIASAGSIREVSNASARALIAIKAAVLVGEYSEEEEEVFSKLETFAKQFNKEATEEITETETIPTEKPKRGRQAKK